MRNRMLLGFILPLACVELAMGQVNTVKGTVYSSEDRLPIIGATVLVKGTNLGTVTDYDGNYTLSNLPANAQTLVISYVGMKAQEIAIKAGAQSVFLASDTEELDEVMVVAYGTQRKASFTGSASIVGSESLDKRVLSNAVSAIEGNASGVQVTSSSGQPGDTPSLRIRGFGSVNASNSPLYVVDGTIYDGYIADINPADIESMTILKDAASTSLYGSSAGNGVVLITTRKGKETGTNVRLNISQGWSTRSYEDYAKVDAFQYYPMQWQMLKNAYVTSGETFDEAAKLASEEIVEELLYNPFTGVADGDVVLPNGQLNPAATSLKWGDDLDWEDAAFQTGYRQEYTLSYDTKTDFSDTYASMSYLDDQGYMLETDFERFSGRLNYNIYPVKWLKSGLNLSLSRVKSNYSTATSSSSSSYSNLTRFVRYMAPIYPIHRHDHETGAYLDAAGNPTTDPSAYTYDYDGNRLSSPGRDAIAETLFNERSLTRNSYTARTFITLTPIKGLNVTANYSLNGYDYRGMEYENPLVGDGTAGPGRLEHKSTQSTSQTFNQLITYQKSIGQHKFDVLLGHENYDYTYKYMKGMKINETVSGMYEFGNFVEISDLSSYTTTYTKEGYFARLNYELDDKYYASVSYRRDGSSRFAPEHRWGNFWSFGLSWRLSQEDFLSSVSWIDNLKLRASYGETGNDNTDSYYPYQTLYGLGYNNSKEAGAYFTSIANPDLIWETQVSSDIALDFGFFDRLSGSVELFQKDSRDLLFDVSQSYSTGVSSILQNIGKVSNQGLEVNLNYTLLDKPSWKAAIGLNASFVRNEIITLPENMREEGYVSGSKKWMEGYSMYEFWLRQWYGVDPATGDGLYLLDTHAYNEADGTLDEDVRETLVELEGKQLTNDKDYALFDYSGTSTPKVYGGFNLSASYRNLDLAATFSYQLGGKVLDLNYQSMMSMSDYGEAMSPDLLDAWQKPGDITNVPRLDNSTEHTSSVGTSYSTRWLVSSDYLNLRSLSLGYSIPAKYLKSCQLKQARINVTCENLFMLKAAQGLNPMENYSGVSYNSYMPTRNFTIGVNIAL